MNVQKGLIHKIERFSLHDGPGIRTLVVMKGCPLSCRWCSSPYTQRPVPEILHIKERCRGCGLCIAVCPNRAIVAAAPGAPVTTDRAQCAGCGACVAICDHQARELSGRPCTAQALLDEVEKDAGFYRRSGGGITVGGGEPTLQAEFVGQFLAFCRWHGFHTAMETCALTSWATLAPLLDSLDLVYIDLKHMDERCHAEWTGASNQGIKDNIRRTALQTPVILRIPVIPGFNDGVDNIAASATFAKALGSNLLRLELLPYHALGVHNYEDLDRPYSLEATQSPTEQHLAYLGDIARSFGIDVVIGG